MAVPSQLPPSRPPRPPVGAGAGRRNVSPFLALQQRLTHPHASRPILRPKPSQNLCDQLKRAEDAEKERERRNEAGKENARRNGWGSGSRSGTARRILTPKTDVPAPSKSKQSAGKDLKKAIIGPLAKRRNRLPKDWTSTPPSCQSSGPPVLPPIETPEALMPATPKSEAKAKEQAARPSWLLAEDSRRKAILEAAALSSPPRAPPNTANSTSGSQRLSAESATTSDPLTVRSSFSTSSDETDAPAIVGFAKRVRRRKTPDSGESSGSGEGKFRPLLRKVSVRRIASKPQEKQTGIERKVSIASFASFASRRFGRIGRRRSSSSSDGSVGDSESAGGEGEGEEWRMVGQDGEDETLKIPVVEDAPVPVSRSASAAKAPPPSRIPRPIPRSRFASHPLTSVQPPPPVSLRSASASTAPENKSHEALRQKTLTTEQKSQRLASYASNPMLAEAMRSPLPRSRSTTPSGIPTPSVRSSPPLRPSPSHPVLKEAPSLAHLGRVRTPSLVLRPSSIGSVVSSRLGHAASQDNLQEAREAAMRSVGLGRPTHYPRMVSVDSPPPTPLVELSREAQMANLGLGRPYQDPRMVSVDLPAADVSSIAFDDASCLMVDDSPAASPRFRSPALLSQLAAPPKQSSPAGAVPRRVTSVRPTASFLKKVSAALRVDRPAVDDADLMNLGLRPATPLRIVKKKNAGSSAKRGEALKRKISYPLLIEEFNPVQRSWPDPRPVEAVQSSSPSLAPEGWVGKMARNASQLSLASLGGFKSAGSSLSPESEAVASARSSIRSGGAPSHLYSSPSLASSTTSFGPLLTAPSLAHLTSTGNEAAGLVQEVLAQWEDHRISTSSESAPSMVSSAATPPSPCPNDDSKLHQRRSVIGSRAVPGGRVLRQRESMLMMKARAFEHRESEAPKSIRQLPSRPMGSVRRLVRQFERKAQGSDAASRTSSSSDSQDSGRLSLRLPEIPTGTLAFPRFSTLEVLPASRSSMQLADGTPRSSIASHNELRNQSRFSSASSASPRTLDLRRATTSPELPQSSPSAEAFHVSDDGPSSDSEMEELVSAGSLRSEDPIGRSLGALPLRDVSSEPSRSFSMTEDPISRFFTTSGEISSTTASTSIDDAFPSPKMPDCLRQAVDVIASPSRSFDTLPPELRELLDNDTGEIEQLSADELEAMIVEERVLQYGISDLETPDALYAGHQSFTMSVRADDPEDDEDLSEPSIRSCGSASTKRRGLCVPRPSVGDRMWASGTLLASALGDNASLISRPSSRALSCSDTCRVLSSLETPTVDRSSSPLTPPTPPSPAIIWRDHFRCASSTSASSSATSVSEARTDFDAPHPTHLPPVAIISPESDDEEVLERDEQEEQDARWLLLLKRWRLLCHEIEVELRESKISWPDSAASRTALNDFTVPFSGVSIAAFLDDSRNRHQSVSTPLSPESRGPKHTPSPPVLRRPSAFLSPTRFDTAPACFPVVGPRSPPTPPASRLTKAWRNGSPGAASVETSLSTEGERSVFKSGGEGLQGGASLPFARPVRARRRR